ncbi:MAG: hypothetical protein LBT02_01645 [Rickettsiales bacterium]|jgi:hypothetical protein|nr:hypothetical protein [Rickettsiales bacterium]
MGDTISGGVTKNTQDTINSAIGGGKNSILTQSVNGGNAMEAVNGLFGKMNAMSAKLDDVVGQVVQQKFFFEMPEGLKGLAEMKTEYAAGFHEAKPMTQIQVALSSGLTATMRSK